MKRIIFTLLAATGLMTVSGQNLNKIKESIAASKFSEAKTAIETLLTNPKNQKNPELYYLKGKVLSAISMNATERASVPDARMLALDAFKKSLEIDKNQSTLYLTVDNYKPVFDLYSSGFEEGAAFYNAAKFEEALGTFKNTGVIGDYIFSQGWGLYKLDTTLIYYMGLSALNAKKEDQAIAYFTKLADANVGGNSDMATPYRYLAKYYFDKKDDVNMNKYIDAGLKIFPKDDYLPLLAIDHARDKNDMAFLLKKFEQLLVINPESFDLMFDYASELFGETHVSDASKRPADYTERCSKIEGLYNKALVLKPDSYETMLSLGKHFYNQVLFLEEDLLKKPKVGSSKETVIRNLGTPSKISKTSTQNIETELLIYENRKIEVGINVKTGKVDYVHELADLNKGIISLIDLAIPQLEKVFNNYSNIKAMKVSEKSNYKSTLNLLIYFYTYKKDTAKTEFYQKKYDEADKRILIGDTKELVIEKLGQPSMTSKTTTENIEIELLIYNNLKIQVGINVKTNKVNYINEIK